MYGCILNTGFGPNFSSIKPRLLIWLPGELMPAGLFQTFAFCLAFIFLTDYNFYFLMYILSIYILVASPSLAGSFHSS